MPRPKPRRVIPQPSPKNRLLPETRGRASQVKVARLPACVGIHHDLAGVEKDTTPETKRTSLYMRCALMLIRHAPRPHVGPPACSRHTAAPRRMPAITWGRRQSACAGPSICQYLQPFRCGPKRGQAVHVTHVWSGTPDRTLDYRPLYSFEKGTEFNPVRSRRAKATSTCPPGGH